MKNTTTPYAVLALGNINDKIVSLVTTTTLNTLASKSVSNIMASSIALALRGVNELIVAADITVVDSVVTLSNYNEQMDKVSVVSIVKDICIIDSSAIEIMEKGLAFLTAKEGNTIADTGININSVVEMDANFSYEMVNCEGKEIWLSRAKDFLDDSSLRRRKEAYVQLMGLYTLGGAYPLRSDSFAYNADNDTLYNIVNVVKVFERNMSEHECLELADVCEQYLSEEAMPPPKNS